MGESLGTTFVMLEGFVVFCSLLIMAKTISMLIDSLLYLSRMVQ